MLLSTKKSLFSEICSMLETFPVDLNGDNIETFITELNCLDICPGNRNFSNVIVEYN